MRNGVLWLIVATNLVAALAAIATNVATERMPEKWQPHLWLAWPLLGLLVVSGVWLAISLHRAGTPREVTPERAAYNRERMLAHVRTRWIDGVLARSVYRQTLVDLGLEDRPEALVRPWDVLLDTPEAGRRVLTAGQSLRDVIAMSDGLLVLGAPGAGKTTMLLTLLEELLDAAARDDTAPIPVVFPLTSWASSGKPLRAWLVDELRGRLYGVSPDLAEHWVANDRILPLLDGLDEVSSDRRLACARAIDQFHSGHQLLPLVVTSRLADYEALGYQLSLGAAVLIQPLSEPQTMKYLKRFGSALAGLRQALAEAPVLWDLLRTPFLLSVAVRAYEGRPAADVGRAGSLEEGQRHLLEAFVDRTLRRKGQLAGFTPEQTVRWLAYIARSLAERLEMFYGPEFISTRWLIPTHRRRLNRLAALLGSVLLGGAVGLPIAVVVHPVTGLGTGLFTAIVYGMIMKSSSPPNVSLVEGDSFGGRVFLVLISWIAFGIVLAVALPVLGGALALIASVPVGIVGVLFGASFLDLMLGMLGIGALWGLLLGLIMPAPFFSELEIYAGGTRRGGDALRDTWWFFCLITVGVSTLAALVLESHWGAMEVLAGAVFGLACGYLYCGRALLGHWGSRAVMAGAGVVPWRQTAFLDFAESRMLMLKVGDGHMFAHRLLFEYFATLEPTHVSSRYASDGLPAADLRPEALLARARRGRPGDNVIRVLTFASSFLPASVWTPTAVEIVRSLGDGSPAVSESNENSETLDVLLAVHRLIATAAFPPHAAASAVALGELLAALLKDPAEPPLRLSYFQRYFDDAISALKATSAGDDQDLAARRAAVLKTLTEQDFYRSARALRAVD
ncbi:NACHT domain-containing protein [Lentzea sp. NPDC092896]|uniref:NACHT domain-containing protein n=1 Tax=Lentzea sp. NPDC092896 TaxID=3364127 RepID=UPI003826CF8A